MKLAAAALVCTLTIAAVLTASVFGLSRQTAADGSRPDGATRELSNQANNQPASEAVKDLAPPAAEPLRPLDGPYDTRTTAGREEIEWLERRLGANIFFALYDLPVREYAIDVLSRVAVVVLSGDQQLTDAARKRIVDTAVMFTGFDAARVLIVVSPYE